MGRVRSFILSNFTKNYLLIFLPFFSILSVIYVIRISSLAGQISLDAGEILKVFGLFVPDILFYTIPISFIAALTSTLMKLSEENELIALFSLGSSPIKILKVFLFPTMLFSALMLVLSLYTIPQSTLSFKKFERDKYTQNQFILEPHKLGQKFGNYIVYVGSKKKDTYNDVVLFAKDNKDKRVIFIANSADIHSDDSIFSLNLYNGTGDTFLSNIIENVQYKQMSIYKYLKSNRNFNISLYNWSNIWTSKHKMSFFVYNIFISISPLLILGILLSFSITNPRYQKQHVYLVSLFATLSVYVVASLLKTYGNIFLLSIVSLLFILISYILFQKRIQKNF